MSGCGISVLGGVQGLTEQVPEQPDLIRPALSRGLDYVISRSPLLSDSKETESVFVCNISLLSLQASIPNTFFP